MRTVDPPGLKLPRSVPVARVSPTSEGVVWKYNVLETLLQPALLWACMFQRYCVPAAKTPSGTASDVPYTC